jgi:DNA-binding NarL/FixJ family response regulator
MCERVAALYNPAVSDLPYRAHIAMHQLNFASGQRIRVVFAGDRPLARLGVEHITSTSPQLELVGIHATAEEFERSSRAFECDVVLVDYSMRGRDDMDGMALLRYLRRTYPSIAAVVLLAQENPVLVRAILARGMTGIVSKFDEVGHIVTAIREARRGVAYLSPAIGRLLAAPGGGLSAREMEVVRLYVSGMTISEIAARTHKAKQTVSTQKNRAMQKLGLRNDMELIRCAASLALLDDVSH